MHPQGKVLRTTELWCSLKETFSVFYVVQAILVWFGRHEGNMNFNT